VATKFLDQFLKEEGYGRMKRILFPKRKYKNLLNDIIYNTIIEHQKRYPFNDALFDGVPFYYTPQVFDYFNQIVLFNSDNVTVESFLHKLEIVDKIILPAKEEIDHFYELLIYRIKQDKILRKLFVEENYKTKIFEISNILEKVQKIDTNVEEIKEKVQSLESILLQKPTAEWLNKQCISAINDLDNRYTPELNFKLEVSNIFEGLGRTEIFKSIFTKQLDEFLIKGRKVLRKDDDVKNLIKPLEDCFNDLIKLHSTINFCSIQKIPIQEIDKYINSIIECLNNLDEFYRNKDKKKNEQNNNSQGKQNFDYELRSISEFYSEIYKIKDFLEYDINRLANNPFLILVGEAGIGKSHMIGDIVSRRMRNNFESIFLLGQHFVTDENPWTQIFKKLQLNTNSEAFLSSINERAKKSEKRIIIFIDAINEGRGKYFWNDNLRSFINEIKSYEWLGLVMTIRTSYSKLIFPDSELKKLSVIFKTIYGFRNSEYEASKLFFENYKIELPNVPLLHPEFQNPLFLKLFCEGINKSGLSRIPDGLQGITSIINFFLKNVNQILSAPKRFNYSNSINLVGKAIDSILKYKIDNKLRYISYEQAIEIVEKTVSIYISKKGFLDELISEGVFSKNLFWKSKEEYEEGIYLAYERFEDHLICEYLLEKDEDIKQRFKEGGDLYEYIFDRRAILINRGLIDALTIQIPEKKGIELYECIPQFQNQYEIIESFIESLLWRKIETISEKSKEYVNQSVFHFKGTDDLFWETILSIAAIPNHFYNAYSLHNHLLKFSLADRDAKWTQSLKYKYDDDSAVKRLIDWAWKENDKSHILDESIKLSSIALAWFNSSTNRQLRDCATKALVCLLQDRMNVLIEVLQMFENVNDPYVYERLFAVAYGCAIRTEQKEYLVPLSEYIFSTIFNDKIEVYPHALLRDYARGVIEFTNYLNLNLMFNVDLARPPYKSKNVKKFPSDKYIESHYKLDYEIDNYKKFGIGQNSILSSMATEYSSKMYGDFGRYTFQRALNSWKVDPNKLSNLAIDWIFKKYGYDAKKHGEFDTEIGSGRGRNSIPNERIGKKYQWIALYEMVARIADNYLKYDEWSYKHEKVVPYNGTWSPYIRDIDPTLLIKKVRNFNVDEQSINWWSPTYNLDWDCPHQDWIKKTEDLPAMNNLIQVKDTNNEEWLIIEGYPEWKEPKIIGNDNWDYTRKLAWTQIRSYLFKSEDFEKIKKWSVNQDFMGRWLPESNSFYEIFSREYYWSPAYRNLNQIDNEQSGWRSIHEKKHEKLIAKTIVTASEFLWEEEFDNSKEEAIRFLKPCTQIFYGMNLKCGRKEGVFYNEKDEIICFDPKLYNNSKSHLLIKRKPFLKFLEDNNLEILWTVLGEKQIIGGNNRFNRMEISGAYYFENNQITGKINTKSE
jgi:hypothetical protein